MKSKNPFYILLLLAAVAFCVTACSYCVMTLKRSAQSTLTPDAEPGGLVRFLDAYGTRVLAALLVSLALCTVAAVWTDGYWHRRARVRAQRESRNDSTS